MTRYVDFQKIKERVPIESIVTHYRLSLEEAANGQLVGDCPFCGDGDEEAKRLKVTPEKNAWKCWSCGEHGNNLDLVALMEDTSLPMAAIFLADTFGITDCEFERDSRKNKRKKTNGNGVSRVSNRKKQPATNGSKVNHASTTAPKREHTDSPNDSEAIELQHNPSLDWPGLKNLDSESEDLANLYVWLPEIAEDFEAGLCSRGMMQGRFAVPIHNIDGELLAYCGIDLEEHSESRLKFPPADKYDPSLDLFNLHRATKDPLYIETGVLNIVQDIIEAFAAYGSGNKNVVATMQGVPTEQQILRLKSLDVPYKAFSISWREPSKDLDQVIAKIAEFSWVRVRYVK